MPIWVALLTAVLLTAGTLAGGWRISYTIGYRLIRIDPLRGFVAQIYSSVILLVGAIGLHWPISTTHTVTAAALGAGANQRFPATNRRVVIRILAFWVLTPVVTAAAAFVLELALSPVAGLSTAADSSNGIGASMGQARLSEAARDVVLGGLLASGC